MLRLAKKLEGRTLHARDGEIGRVADLFFDDRQWTTRYFVIETGSWLDSRKVLISPAAFGAPAEEGNIPVNLTRAQVSNSPRIDPTRPVSREHESELTHYYNWPAYWGTMGFDAGFAMPMVPADVAAPSQLPARAVTGGPSAVQEEHHLRSMRAVSRFQIEAADGAIGHVHDFLVEDRTWEIFYLVVDTRAWLPGKHVLLSPRWIDEVGWDEAKVFVNVTRATIKNSPPYDAEHPPTADYAARLHDHYGRPRHAGW